MTVQVIPVAFWAETQVDAEAQALAWADQPRIASAHVVDARETFPDRWTVDLDVTLREEPGEPAQEVLPW